MIVKNVNSSEPKLTYLNSFFCQINCLKPKDIHFTVIGEKNLHIFTFEKQEAVNFWYLIIFVSTDQHAQI